MNELNVEFNEVFSKCHKLMADPVITKIRPNHRTITANLLSMPQHNTLSKNSQTLKIYKSQTTMSVTLKTDVGDIKIELHCELVPKTCENFLALCASGYYEGCIFHRNMKGFMVQTGDPLGTGKGGTSIWGKKFPDEFKDELRHTARGVVCMANSGPNTNGSQFFITYAPQPHLDLKYTVFGRVIDGFDALEELEKLPVNQKNFKPLTDTRVLSVVIHANPLATNG